MQVMRKLLVGVAVLGVLACVFAMYLQGDFMLQLANQVWACF
ncbi:MAG: hypothetical protein ACOVOD_05040 [Rhodoferax sp.]